MANYNYNHYNLPFLHIMIIVIISGEVMLGEWNKLNTGIRTSVCYNMFRKSVLSFIRPSASKVYNINDTILSLLSALPFL